MGGLSSRAESGIVAGLAWIKRKPKKEKLGNKKVREAAAYIPR